MAPLTGVTRKIRRLGTTGHEPDMARHKRSWLIPMVSSHGIFRITLIKEPMIIELVPGTNRVCWVHPLTIIDVGWNLNLWWF